MKEGGLETTVMLLQLESFFFRFNTVTHFQRPTRIRSVRVVWTTSPLSDGDRGDEARGDFRIPCWPFRRRSATFLFFDLAICKNEAMRFQTSGSQSGGLPA